MRLSLNQKEGQVRWWQRKIKSMLSSLMQPQFASSTFYVWELVLGVCIVSVVNPFLKISWFFKTSMWAEGWTNRNAAEERFCWIFWGGDGEATGRGLGYRALPKGGKVRPEWRSVGARGMERSGKRPCDEPASRENLSAQPQGWPSMVHSFKYFPEGWLWPAAVPGGRDTEVARQSSCCSGSSLHKDQCSDCQQGEV